MKVAFLHTLSANIDLFTPYIEKYLPNIEIQHFVSEYLLKNAMQFGVEQVRQDVNNVINDITKHNVDIIICSCSTIGALAEEAKVNANVSVLRVDRPMAEAAVLHSNILVLAAVESTFTPTLTLLKAVSDNPELLIHTQLVEGAWQHYAAGDTQAYVNCISEYLAKLMYCSSSQKYDVIVIAQASMAPAIKALKTDNKLPVYSSPELCLRYLQKRIVSDD